MRSLLTLGHYQIRCARVARVAVISKLVRCCRLTGRLVRRAAPRSMSWCLIANRVLSYESGCSALARDSYTVGTGHGLTQVLGSHRPVQLQDMLCFCYGISENLFGAENFFCNVCLVVSHTMRCELAKSTGIRMDQVLRRKLRAGSAHAVLDTKCV